MMAVVSSSLYSRALRNLPQTVKSHSVLAKTKKFLIGRVSGVCTRSSHQKCFYPARSGFLIQVKMDNIHSDLKDTRVPLSFE